MNEKPFFGYIFTYKKVIRHYRKSKTGKSPISVKLSMIWKEFQVSKLTQFVYIISIVDRNL